MKTYTLHVPCYHTNYVIVAQHKWQAMEACRHTFNLAYDSIIVCLGINL